VEHRKARKGVEIPESHIGRPPYVWAITKTGQRAAESFFPSLKDVKEWKKGRARRFISEEEMEGMEKVGREYAKFLKNL